MTDYGARPRGLSPLTSLSMYRKITLPSMLYGCELWYNMKAQEINVLNKTQHTIIKKMQGFQKYTRSDMCQSLVGQYDLVFEIDKMKLLFFFTTVSCSARVSVF